MLVVYYWVLKCFAHFKYKIGVIVAHLVERASHVPSPQHWLIGLIPTCGPLLHVDPLSLPSLSCQSLQPHSPTLLVSGEGPVWLHQEGDGSIPSVHAGLPAGAAADGTLQPSDGSVGTDRPAHAAGRAHTEPQAQTLGAEGVLRQGLWRCRAQCGGAGGVLNSSPYRGPV